MLKTQNLCCHREGRVNTKWKLVRGPGREMGSVSISLPLLEGSNSWTAKSNCWGWAAPENKLMVFRVLRSIYDFGRDIYLSRSSHQRTHYYERIVGESYYIKALSTLRVPTIGVFITSLDWKNFTSWNYETLGLWVFCSINPVYYMGFHALNSPIEYTLTPPFYCKLHGVATVLD